MTDRYFGLSPRIARWKISSQIENWLSKKADESELWKRVYVNYYNIFDHKYFAKGVEMAEKAILNHVSGKYLLEKITSQNIDKTNIRSVVTDMIYCLHRFGLSFQDYCLYDLAHHKSLNYRQSFVSDKLRYYYCDLLNSPEIYQIMTDKYACYKAYKSYFKRDVVGCFTSEDEEQLRLFLSKHSSFIFKPLEEHSGHGIDIFKTEQINVSDFFKNKLKDGAFVVEELIEQGYQVGCMHPQSINSCRVMTFTDGKEVTILGTTWRVGSGAAIKDNAGSGGMYAFIKPETGIIETDAINYKGEQFEKHPDTGIQFKGFQMPDWEAAMNLVTSIATEYEGSTLIAWDIAYSTKGWLMVEANENGDWSLIQSNKKIGLKDKLYELMDKYFQTNKSYVL